MYSLEEINKVDSQGNSAMIFVAVNNNKEIANFMLVNNVEIYGINLDKNGIIQFYFDRIKEVKNLTHDITYKIYFSTCRLKECQSETFKAKASYNLTKFTSIQKENESDLNSYIII